MPNSLFAAVSGSLVVNGLVGYKWFSLFPKNLHLFHEIVSDGFLFIDNFQALHIGAFCVMSILVVVIDHVILVRVGCIYTSRLPWAMIVSVPKCLS